MTTYTWTAEWPPTTPQKARDLDLATLSPGCTLADVVRICVACGCLPRFEFTEVKP